MPRRIDCAGRAPARDACWGDDVPDRFWNTRFGASRPRRRQIQQPRFSPQASAKNLFYLATRAGPDAPRASASSPTSRPLLAVRIVQILRHMLDPLRRLAQRSRDLLGPIRGGSRRSLQSHEFGFEFADAGVGP